MVQIIVKTINEISKEELQEFDAVSFIFDEESFKRALAQNCKMRKLYWELLEKKVRIILVHARNINQAKEFLRKFARAFNLEKILILYG